jgi:hypothetical protein
MTPRPHEVESAFRNLGIASAVVITLIAVGLVWLFGGFGG